MPAGRPTKYLPEYCQKIVEYFDIEPFQDVEVVHRNTKTGSEWTETVRRANPPRFVEAFARSIGVCKDTLHEWARVHPEFSDALKEAREKQEQHFSVNALQSLFNPTFTIFAAKNMFGWRDEQYIKQDTNIKVEEVKSSLQERLKCLEN